MHGKRKPDLAQPKLILLYALQKLGLQATVTVLSELTAGRDWMNYFEMRQNLLELSESGFLKSGPEPEQYALTGAGLSALGLYKKRIPIAIRTQIDEFVRKHGDKIARRTEIRADFTQDSDEDFPVTLSILENGREIFRLNLTATTRREAAALCERFEAEAPGLYAELVHRLTRDDAES
ncbi:MAG: DUF4364 family protein [Christensenellales bacterium]|jgi:hypothetical protein